MTDARLRLATQLLLETVDNKLSWPRVRPAVLTLLGDERTTNRQALIEALSAHADGTIVALRRELLGEQMSAARRVHEARSRQWAIDTPTRAHLSHLPLDVEHGFTGEAALMNALSPVHKATTDLAFATTRAETARPAVERSLERSVQAAALPLRHAPWAVRFAIERVMSDATPELARDLAVLREHDDTAMAARRNATKHALENGAMLGAQTADEETLHAWLAAEPSAAKRLTAVLQWPTDAACGLIAPLVQSAVDEERACVMLTIRTGEAFGFSFGDYAAWLDARAAEHAAARERLRAAITAAPEAVIVTTVSSRKAELGSLAQTLLTALVARVKPAEASAFAARWSTVLSAEEHAAIVVGATALKAETPAPPSPRFVEPAAPKKPAEPGVLGMLWREHLQGFIADNWYLVLGLFLVLVGASLLAYFTWDKHWLLRYTLAPLLLGAFTVGVARLGTWLVAKDDKLKGSAALLRGTAVALLPLNFMTVALFADDPAVPMKVATVPLFALVYIAFGAINARRWTAALNASIAAPFALTLVGLNALVFMAPLGSMAAAWFENGVALAAGAYLGLAIVYAFLRGFVFRRPELLADRTLVLFCGLSLLFTYVQTQLWVFGYLHVLPEPSLYALLFVAAGHLVLMTEKELGEERKKEASFIGFALLGIGVLLGLGDPWMRVFAFVAAGGSWLRDAWKRPHPVAHWIGLVLVTLGLASALLLDGVPHVAIGPAVIALALLHLGIAAFAAPHDEALTAAARGLHATLLFLAAITVMGAQWTWHATPWAAGGELVILAALFFVAAERDARLPYVYSGAFLVAFALPYFGFVDLDTLELEGNLMPLGLSLAAAAWIALVRLTQAPRLVQARSTVLSFYGALAIAAMAVRLTAERDSDVVSTLHMAAELSGPFAMALLMLAATYFSRSWIPAAMAGLIVVVLVPDLKAALHIAQSSGIGSALIGLSLLLASFYLRRAPFLRELPPGDAWLVGEKFPFARYDHTLFTAPLVLTMAILTLRTDTFTVLKRMNDANLPFVAALFVTVVSHTLLGVYLGKARRGTTFVYLAVPVLYIALSFANALVAQWRPLDVLVATGLLVHGAYFAYSRFGLDRELLADPMRKLLENGSLLTALLAATLLFAGLHPLAVAGLAAFSFYQLIWHGHARAERRYGALLFALVLVSAVGADAWREQTLWLSTLPERLSLSVWFPAALSVAAAIYGVLLVCELVPAAHTRWSALIVPSHVGAAALAIVLCAVATVGIFVTPAAPTAWIVTAFVLIAIAARAERSVPIALYGFVCVIILPVAMIIGETHSFALGFALASSLLIALVAALRLLSPRVLSGSFPLAWLSSESLAPAFVLALFGCALGEIALFADTRWTTLVAGFVIASNVGLVARAWKKPILHYAGWASLASANVLVAMTHLRAPLLAWGLGDAHVVAVGLGVTLLVASALSLLARDPAMTRTAERSSTLLATAIIGLLTIKYLVHPDLGSMTWQRFAISGVAAYLAALYLRLAARRSGSVWLMALYHFGVTMALWCAALLLPPLRAPGAALIALGVPLLYFYARAELGRSAEEQRSYADSATAISFVVFAVYTLRFAVQLVLFADTPADHGYYHSNAPAMIVLGLIMFRLHALRKNAWLATYGGFTLILASFFLATWPARFSPFQHMDHAALVGVLLAHFWIAFAAYGSPLRSGLMTLGAVSLEEWPGHARVWSVVLLFGVHVLVALAFVFAPGVLLAPLVFGLVTVVWHLASGWRSSSVFVLGALELLAALHLGFVESGGVPARFVVWSVLACFLVLVVARRVLAWLFDFTAVGRAAIVLSVVTMAHVTFHGPSSAVGLLAVAVLALISSFTPFARGFRSELPLAEMLLVAALPWLVYFSQVRDDVVAPWPLHAVAATLLVIAAVARWIHDAGKTPAFDRLGAATLAFLGERHRAVQIALGALTLLLLVFVRYVSWKAALPYGQVALVCVAYGAIGYGAWAKGRAQRVAVLFLLAEYCLEQIFESVRYEVVLTNAELWTPHYDIVAMLAASLALAAVKELVDLEREGLFPVVGTLIGLPVAALTWTVWNGLSLDVALFVIGVNSLIFAFMGRNGKESPYNVLAIFGFIAFVLSVFKGKLELTALHAYVIPVGVGVLALVHLYERVLERSTRANIRLITLTAMLASAGYHALLDNRFPLAFHLSFILLSVAMMTVGVAMRVKLYLVIGFFGALLDALVLLVKAVAFMDRGPRMTLIGAFVLLVGAALVFGAIYYKAHKDELLERYGRWRGRFAGWE